MKEFVIINRAPTGYGSNEAKEVIGKWNLVTNKWKSEGIFVASFVIPNEGYLISPNNTEVKKGFVTTDNLKIVSFITIKASDFASAVELAKASPVLEQGGIVEVSEVLSRQNSN